MLWRIIRNLLATTSHVTTTVHGGLAKHKSDFIESWLSVEEKEAVQSAQVMTGIHIAALEDEYQHPMAL